MTTQSLGFLGLGNLGAPIAHNLVAAGHAVRVWNRTPAKTAPLAAAGATVASSPRDAVVRGGVTFSILWDDASVDEVVSSDGFLDAFGAGGVHVAMSTITPAGARRLAARHAERGVAYVEAPIFGVPAQAVARTMMVCTAGDAAAKQRVAPLFTDLGAARVFDFGDAVGGGTATKLAGNFLIIAGFVAMQEVYDVLVASGVDPKPTLDMLTTTLLATPGLQRYAASLLSGAPPSTSGVPLKDVGLFQQVAGAAHAATPLAERMHAILAKR
jgi:3-hydroxyisobutyrate dehydrogenase-like beta-hydroxyacid dehydrogenase|nr:NAD(P)-dependent oxidoreductase [Kofleriaceae bacterium]